MHLHHFFRDPLKGRKGAILIWGTAVGGGQPLCSFFKGRGQLDGSCGESGCLGMAWVHSCCSRKGRWILMIYAHKRWVVFVSKAVRAFCQIWCLPVRPPSTHFILDILEAARSFSPVSGQLPACCPSSILAGARCLVFLAHHLWLLGRVSQEMNTHFARPIMKHSSNLWCWKTCAKPNS